MAATPGRPGSAAVRTGRSTPLIFRTEVRRISAARRSVSPAPSGMTIVAAGRPWSTKTNARPQRESSTGRGLNPQDPPGAHAVQTEIQAMIKATA